MEQIKELENLLRMFPLWGDAALQIDETEPKPGSCGLFPLGIQELSRREDVTGNVRTRLRQRYVLRRVIGRGEDAAAWLLALQTWLWGKQLPGFGSDCQVRAEKGSLSKARQAGTDLYEATITLEYTKEHKYED